MGLRGTSSTTTTSIGLLFRPPPGPAERLLVQKARGEVEVAIAVAPDGGMGHLRVMAFRQTARLMIDELIERLKADGHEGVHPSHHALYENIDPEGTRLTELAARAAMTHQSMSELVAGLERGGWSSAGPTPPTVAPGSFISLPRAATSSSAACTTSPRSKPNGRSAGARPATTARCARCSSTP